MALVNKNGTAGSFFSNNYSNKEFRGRNLHGQPKCNRQMGVLQEYSDLPKYEQSKKLSSIGLYVKNNSNARFKVEDY
jgi:hypothetical protein